MSEFNQDEYEMNVEVYGEELTFALSHFLSFDLIYDEIDEYNKFCALLEDLVYKHDSAVLEHDSIYDPSVELDMPPDEPPEGGVATWTLHPATEALRDDVMALDEEFELTSVLLYCPKGSA